MIDFTENDSQAAGEVAWKAIQDYAKEKHICQGCLSIAVTQDILFNTTKNLITDENQLAFMSQIAKVLKDAIEARKTNQGMNRAERRKLKSKMTKLLPDKS